MPRTLKLLLLVCALAAPLCASAQPAQSTPPQHPPPPEDKLARGRRLYEQGDDAAAVPLLRDAAEMRKTDGDAWYFYGLALNRSGKKNDARRAFERAVELRPGWAEAHAGLAVTLLYLGRTRDAEPEASRALALDDKSAPAHYVVGAALLGHYAVESERANEQYPMPADADEETRKPVFEKREAALAPLKARMRATAERLEALAGSWPGAASSQAARELADTLRVYGSRPGDPAAPVYRQAQVTRKALITYKPEPGYTNEARRNDVRGVVRLRAVLADDGRVKHILVIKGLPGGLTEQAIAAARRIRFTPAAVDDRPVSQFVILEYNFN